MNATDTLSLVPATDPVLRSPAALVTDFETQVRPHLEAMRELMATKRGIGLAAPQVGIPLQFFITSFERFRVVVNPVIVAASGSNVAKPEGCLTWPGRTTFVARRHRVLVEWLRHGEIVRGTFTGLEARCFQHETDHLNGICIFN